MPSFFDNVPLPDSRQLRDLLGQDFPWKLIEQAKRNRDASWLGQMVQGLLDSSGAPVPESGSERGRWLRSEVVKNDKYVVVALALPKAADRRGLRLFASSDRLKVIEATSERKRSVPFPCLVYPRSGRAVWRDDRLIVKFRRRKPDRNEVELFIRP